MIRSEHIDCWKLTNTKQIKNIPRMEMLSAFLTLRIFIVDYPNDPIVWILSHHTHTQHMHIRSKSHNSKVTLVCIIYTAKVYMMVLYFVVYTHKIEQIELILISYFSTR